MPQKQQYVDVLGDRVLPETLCSRELLSEADDRELQDIVEQAAAGLKAPIALVTLVLDHIQFFKAHYGLPEDLVASRGSRRDASFCQFVVRDGTTLEVTNAAGDESLPQYFVQEYDICSYLGVPLRLGDAVVGSLCVLDTESRKFSRQERDQLEKLAVLVEVRMAALASRRHQAWQAIAERTAPAMLAELSASLAPARDGTRAGLAALPAIRGFLKLAAHALEGGQVRPEVMKSTLSSAAEALTACEDALYEVEAATGDCADCIVGLERLTLPADSVALSELLMAAQDLSRPSTRQVGDAPLPDLAFDPHVRAPRPLAVALLTACFTGLAEAMLGAGRAGGIATRVHPRDDAVTIALSAEGLAAAVVKEVALQVGAQLGQDPSVAIAHREAVLELVFRLREPAKAPAPATSQP